jgi:apolipoprotein N-acyltransferase
MNNRIIANKKKIYLTGILTGVLLALAFPPIPLSLLAFIGLIPILFALEQKDYKKPFLLLYLTFFIYHGGTNWWISSWRTETDPYLMISGFTVWLVHPFFFYVPFIFFIQIKKKFGLNLALWLFPFIWTGFEWLHSLGDFSYPWLTLGYTQIYDRFWVQAADICGVWGLSFLIVLVNVVVYKLLLLYNKSAGEKRAFRILLRKPHAKGYMLVLVLLLLLPNIYGFIRIPQYDHLKLLANNKNIKIGIVQPNIDPWRKWDSNVFKQINEHKHISDSLRRASGGLDVLIWSETAVPFISYKFNSDHNFSYIQNWVDSNQTSLLTGFTDIYFYLDKSMAPKTAKLLYGDSSLIYDAYNAAVILNPKPYNMNNQIYRKMKLTPFAERIPYEELFIFARKWLEWGVGISSWAKGPKQSLLVMRDDDKTAKFGSIICIESIYPNFVRNFVCLGADVLTVITNDAWYDYTVGPEQHYQIACMRAIETRRYIARCANTGVSGFISPMGESILRAAHYKSVGIAASIPLLIGKSLYVRYGDWLPILSVLLTFSAFLISFFKKVHD